MSFKYLLLVSVFLFSVVGAHSSEKEAVESCASLKFRDKSQAVCVKFVAENQTSKAVFELCGSGFKDAENQLKCIRSGAEKEDMQRCLALRWSEDNLLTCLIFGSNAERVEACGVFSRNEESQVKCLKLGRHPSQVIACSSFSVDDEQKLDCLSVDTPAYAVKDCKRINKTEVDRLKCLQSFVDPNLK